MFAISRENVTLPADFIQCSACLAQIEQLIAATGGFVDVTVDFETGRTSIEYPVPTADFSSTHDHA